MVKTNYDLRPLREAAQQIRSSIMPKSITPEIVGGLMADMIEAFSDLIETTLGCGILPFDGILESETDMACCLEGVYYCRWDGIMREVVPQSEDDPAAIVVVGTPKSYNHFVGTKAKHASERVLFRLGNRLYRYDATEGDLVELTTGGGGSGDGCSCTAIPIVDIDRVIENAGVTVAP